LPSGRERWFRSRETRVEAVIREAWTDRIITTIVPEPDDSTGVRLVILRR
jgi:hypothetical protein